MEFVGVFSSLYLRRSLAKSGYEVFHGMPMEGGSSFRNPCFLPPSKTKTGVCIFRHFKISESTRKGSSE